MDIFKAEPGTKVKFVGGHLSDKLPHDLELGKIYTISAVRVYAWHTNIYLKESNGCFNSTWFEDVKENDQ